MKSSISRLPLTRRQTIQGGKARVELKEVFAILADGVAREEEMTAAGASKSEIEKEWLPGCDVARTNNAIAQAFTQAC